METQDTVELNRTREETVDQCLEFEVSGPSSAAFPSGPDGLVESDRHRRKRSQVPDDSQDESDEDDSDDGMMGEATSDSEGDDEKTSKTGGKPKSSTGSSKRSRYADEIPEDYCFLKCMGYISTYNI